MSLREVGQEDEEESRTRSECNEDLEDVSFWVEVSDRCGNGWKPFVRVLVVLILDYTVVVKAKADDEGGREGN